MKRKYTGGAQVALEDEQCQDASPFWLVNRFACNSCLACSTRHPPFHPVLQQAVMNVCKHAHNTLQLVKAFRVGGEPLIE